MPNLLYSIHDRDAHPIIPAGGWCVDAVLVTDQPPNYRQIRDDINFIVRLNHGWHPDGTIPLRAQYPEYAKRCADFVALCKGASWFVISNEPNHQIELPHGVKIEPEDYAACFNACYAAIKTLRREVNVCVAAVAPWDITSGMDWLVYYRKMLDAISECDGLAIHGYTHGPAPSLIASTEKVHGWFWHFPVIYQTIAAIPPKFAHLPVHVTETDQGDNAWLDINHGWVQDAYKSIDDHNRQGNTQKILSLSLYRWRGDKYEIHNKPQVQADFKAAVAKGYPSPMPQPPQPPTTDRDIDPRLFARGVEFDFITPPAGTWYWRMTKAQWLDNAAQQVGPDHHILGRVLSNKKEMPGVPLRVEWPSGSTTITSKADQPNVIYNYDFAMSASLNEFGIQVSDGAPSDKVYGIGMGKDGNPGIHTSTWINFEYVQAAGAILPPQPQPPTQPGAPSTGKLILPVNGVRTQRFGENPANYAKYGAPGHNGTDWGANANTPVVAIADGIVKFSGVDVDYGFYCRIYHPQFKFHSFMAHLIKLPNYPAGTQVKQGQAIGYVGSTGNSSGNHLHLEIRLGSENEYAEGTFGYGRGRVDPETVLYLFRS